MITDLEGLQKGYLSRKRESNTNARNILTLWTVVLERNWPGAVGSPIQVSRKGKASPLEAGRGKGFPACEPEKGHCGGCEATGRWFTKVYNCQVV